MPSKNVLLKIRVQAECGLNSSDCSVTVVLHQYKSSLIAGWNKDYLTCGSCLALHNSQPYTLSQLNVLFILQDFPSLHLLLLPLLTCSAALNTSAHLQDRRVQIFVHDSPLPQVYDILEHDCATIDLKKKKWAVWLNFLLYIKNPKPQRRGLK